MPRIQEEIHQCSTSTYRIVPTLERFPGHFATNDKLP